MNIPNYKYLKFEKKDHIGLLIIDRPQKLNALNVEVLKELKRFYENTLLKDLKGLIMTGSGERAFIAGADIQEMSLMNSSEAKAFSHLGQEVTHLIEQLSIATIAAVDGFALGGGLEIALAHDFIFITKNAVLGLPEVSLGLLPGFGGTQRLARCVGNLYAKEMIFTGKKIFSEEAISIKLAHKVYENKEELLGSAEKFIEVISKNSPRSLAAVKNIFLESFHYKEFSLETKYFADLFGGDEMMEGTQAFLEKRTAYFRKKSRGEER